VQVVSGRLQYSGFPSSMGKAAIKMTLSAFGEVVSVSVEEADDGLSVYGKAEQAWLVRRRGRTWLPSENAAAPEGASPVPGRNRTEGGRGESLSWPLAAGGRTSWPCRLPPPPSPARCLSGITSTTRGLTTRVPARAQERKQESKQQSVSPSIGWQF
jgi:hypothetical protein